MGQIAMPTAPCPETVVESLRAHLGDDFRKVEVVSGQTRVTIDRRALVSALKFLKRHEECPFEQLSDVTAADLSQLPNFDAETDDRFVVMYVLFSMSKRTRLILRCPVPESDPTIETSLHAYKTGVWTEREVYEMFGIRFVGHPNLKRLLTPDYFDAEQQYPLRKDYPLRGIGDRYNFPVYDPAEELDMSRFGYHQENNDDNKK